jgi:hypothetical protein
MCLKTRGNSHLTSWFCENALDPYLFFNNFLQSDLIDVCLVDRNHHVPYLPNQVLGSIHTSLKFQNLNFSIDRSPTLDH